MEWNGTQQLVFGHKFNHPIAGMKEWPPNLRVLSFGYEFNQSVASVALPPRLEVSDAAFVQGVQRMAWRGMAVARVLWVTRDRGGSIPHTRINHDKVVGIVDLVGGGEGERSEQCPDPPSLLFSYNTRDMACTPVPCPSRTTDNRDHGAKRNYSTLE